MARVEVDLAVDAAVGVAVVRHLRRAGCRNSACQAWSMNVMKYVTFITLPGLPGLTC